MFDMLASAVGWTQANEQSEASFPEPVPAASHRPALNRNGLKLRVENRSGEAEEDW